MIACLIFADIDHLKEINDTFGHAAGDFAIKTCADYLRNCMPPDSAIARIGGDEYVALVIMDKSDNGEILTERLSRYACDFNKACDKPFYVEMSAGIYEFICGMKADIPEILKHSDSLIKGENMRRRPSFPHNAVWCNPASEAQGFCFANRKALYLLRQFLRGLLS